MTTPFLELDVRWDEAPGGEPILHAYPDPLSHGPPWTIGFGSTGPDVGPETVWTREKCFRILQGDLANITVQCEDAFIWWHDISPIRQDVFVNMAYQLGFTGLLGFHGTLAEAARGNWEGVALHMRQSLWNKQTHLRSERLAEQVRTGVRLPRSYDPRDLSPAQVAPSQKESTLMSLISSAFRFVFDHAFAAAARQAATANPDAAAAGIVAVQSTPMPTEGSPNSTAGQASPLIRQLEDDLNAVVMTFVKAGVDQLPVVGGLAQVTGLDQKAADAAKAMLVMGEQHALTYLSALFSGHHIAVNAVTVPTSNGIPPSNGEAPH